MKPNTNFELNVKDIEIIENALRCEMRNIHIKKRKEINELLGKIHNQKRWYSPPGFTPGG